MRCWNEGDEYEDLVAMTLFEPGEWMFSFDFKSGYHHIDVAPHQLTYLGFVWEGKIFTFAVLPFGLLSASYVFTTMMRPLVRLWRSQGLKSVVYIDDGICAAPCGTEALGASRWVRETVA